MDKTTIQIDKKTLDRLKLFKKHSRESYEEVINKILNELEEETLSDEEISDIKRALDNVKRGRVKPIEQVAKESGITLI